MASIKMKISQTLSGSPRPGQILTAKSFVWKLPSPYYQKERLKFFIVPIAKRSVLKSLFLQLVKRYLVDVSHVERLVVGDQYELVAVHAIGCHVHSCK